MKRFKNILNEFRENQKPPRRDGDGDGDPVNRVIRFMDSVPFTHSTNNGDTIHFKSSKDAGMMVAENLSKHERGYMHSMKATDPFMQQYFKNSAITHEGVLDSLMNHIANHPKLPSELRKYVPGAIEYIQLLGSKMIDTVQHFGTIASPTGKPVDMGEVTYKRKLKHGLETLANNLENPFHHLHDVVEEVSEDPDIGYVLKKEEM